MITQPAWRAGQSNEPAGLKPSKCSWKTGATSCCNNGGSVFLIMFKTRHALLLSSLRFFCPRRSREIHTAQSRNDHDWRTRHQSQSGRDTAPGSSSPGHWAVFDLSIDADKFRELSRLATLRATVHRVHQQTRPVIGCWLLNGHKAITSASQISFQSLSAKCPRRRIAVIQFPTVSFHVSIRTRSHHVLV